MPTLDQKSKDLLAAFLSTYIIDYLDTDSQGKFELAFQRIFSQVNTEKIEETSSYNGFVTPELNKKPDLSKPSLDVGLVSLMFKEFS